MARVENLDDATVHEKLSKAAALRCKDCRRNVRVENEDCLACAGLKESHMGPHAREGPFNIDSHDALDLQLWQIAFLGRLPSALRVACEGAAALQRCKSAKHLQRCKALLPQVSSPAKAERSAFGQVAQRF